MKLTAFAFLIFASCNAGALQGSLFRPAVIITLVHKPSNVALANLNKDGRLDLIVVSEEARTIEVMFGEKEDVRFRIATAQTPRLIPYQATRKPKQNVVVSGYEINSTELPGRARHQRFSAVESEDYARENRFTGSCFACAFANVTAQRHLHSC